VAKVTARQAFVRFCSAEIEPLPGVEVRWEYQIA